MDVAQKKNISLTVIAAILFMITVLALFFNKITTPRYISDIELKINGLVLIKPALALQNPNLDDKAWLLLTHNETQKEAANALIKALPKKIAKYTAVEESVASYENLSDEVILVAKPNEGVIAYFKPEFEVNKMKLTYSSVFTHR